MSAVNPQWSMVIFCPKQVINEGIYYFRYNNIPSFNPF